MSEPTERTQLLPGEAAIDKDAPRPRIKLVLGAVWIGVFIGALDTTIVASCLAPISSEFRASERSSLLGTAYLLSTATATPLYGRLADIVGRRNANLLAQCFFFVGTALCALAPTMNTLIAARLIAGLGGGGLMTTSSIIASDLVPLRKRGLMQGITNICFGAGAGLGGPLGGWLADTIGWRWAFWIQLPVLALAFVLVFLLVRYQTPGASRSKAEMLRRIDWGGSATLCLGLGGLILGLAARTNDLLPWANRAVWIPLVISAVGFLAFALVEAKFAAEPVLPLRLLTQRSPLAILLANFFTSAAAFTTLYYWPTWSSTVKLSSSASAGLKLLPNSVALSTGSLLAGFVMRKTGRYYWLTLIASTGPILGMVLFAVMNRDTPNWLTYAVVAPSGLGFAVTITSTLIALIASVDREDMAVATGASYLFRYSGQVIGVALSGTILQAILAGELDRRITGPGSADLIERIRHKASLVRELPPAQGDAAVAAYQVALRAVFIFGAGLAAMVTVNCLFIKEHPLPSSFAPADDDGKATPDRSGASTPAPTAARGV